MPRRSLFNVHRPVLGGAHGGTVHHNPFEVFLSSRLALEVVLGILALVLVVSVGLTIRASLITSEDVHAPTTLDTAMRSYDAVEDLRATRLVVGDRSYDAIESLRTTRSVALPGVADRTYDAIEEIRINR